MSLILPLISLPRYGLIADDNWLVIRMIDMYERYEGQIVTISKYYEE